MADEPTASQAVVQAPVPSRVVELGKYLFDPEKPLWVPDGTVRAVITLMLVADAVGMAWTGRPVPEWLALMAGSAFGYYFGARTAETKKT